MAWYNQNLTDDSYAQFQLHHAESTASPASVLDCYQQEWECQGARVELKPDQARVTQLESRLAAAWIFYKFIKDSLSSERICVSADKSHLKGFGNGGNPLYTSCIYLQLKYGEQSFDILNLSVVSNDVNVEIRHPKAELFSETLYIERVQDHNRPPLGWISGLPMLSMRRFLGVDEAHLNQELVICPSSILATEILLYVKSIIQYLDAGEKLRTFGESQAETVLYRDLAAIYANCQDGAPRLLHGQRPISNNGSWLELDLQILFENNIKIAIEIQGPFHYPAKDEGNWEYIQCKHITKIKWCVEHGLIFVWLDWEAFNRCVVHSGQRKRTDAQRQPIIRELMNNIIKAHTNGHRFINVQMDGTRANLTYGLNVPTTVGNLSQENGHNTMLERHLLKQAVEQLIQSLWHKRDLP